MSAARSRGARSVPALYGALTTGLVAVVLVVASVVVPATPPSLAELSPSARDRIEEAREEQGISSGDGIGGTCAPENAACLESKGLDPAAWPNSGSGIPSPLQVAAGRRCFGDPPRQTEDPHSPPCVFEIFKGDNGGATAPGVTATEIRVAAIDPSAVGVDKAVVEALFAHFNLRYEFYGRRLTPVFVPFNGSIYDPAANRAHADDLIAAKPFAVASLLVYATNAVIHRRLSQAGVISAVTSAPAFDSDVLTEGLTWSADPPLDVRLRAGAGLVCRALDGRPASHAGADVRATTTTRRFAVVVLTEPASPDPGPLESGLRGCGADFETFEVPYSASQAEFETLMARLKAGGFTTVLTVSSSINVLMYLAASEVAYFPEWMDLGTFGIHAEAAWAASFYRPFTNGHGDHAFGLTPDVRVRPEAEWPATWALQEGGGTAAGLSARYSLSRWYEPLLILASGIQGAGPNLTPETFAQALRTMEFPNPNPGAPPYWQQGIGFGPGDQVFHHDYALWWWNEDAPSQTSQSESGRGSFCYLGRGARFTVETFPAEADTRLFSASEPCR